MKYLLLVLLWMPLNVLAQTLPTPPQPLPCADVQTCVRDPQKLEAFVAGFYRWYFEDDITYDQISMRIDSAHFQNHRKQHDRMKERVFQHLLTRSFIDWRNSTWTKETNDLPQDTRYCSPDTYFLTCSQDFSKGWLKVSAQLLSIDARAAILLVRLPWEEHPNENPHLLIVRLKPEEGIWKINGVLDAYPERWY